jgi:hypothetical protein
MILHPYRSHLRHIHEVNKLLVVLYLDVTNMITSAAPIIKIVVNPKMLDIFPLVLSCNISLSLSIVMRAIRMSTATTLFITAAYTSD